LLGVFLIQHAAAGKRSPSANSAVRERNNMSAADENAVATTLSSHGS